MANCFLHLPDGEKVTNMRCGTFKVYDTEVIMNTKYVSLYPHEIFVKTTFDPCNHEANFKQRDDFCQFRKTWFFCLSLPQM